MNVYYAACDECPWTGRYASQAKADYAHSRHSCARHREAVAARMRGREAAAAVDRTPKPCLHKQAQHVHGTHAAYVLDRCRCVSCRDANTAYERTRSRRTAYGTWQPYVPAERAREHVTFLGASGIGLKRVAVLSGVPHGVLWKLMYGKTKPDGTRTPSKRVRAETEAKILAVQPSLDLLGSRVSVDGTGTRRRLQALVALGYSMTRISTALGKQVSNFSACFTADRVAAATALDVRRLYDEWSMRLPDPQGHRERISVSRARNYAEAHGWLPPLAWDDDELDAPEGERDIDLTVHDDVDEVAVLRALAGEQVELTHDERLEVAARFMTGGGNKTQLAVLFRMSGTTVDRLLAEVQQWKEAS